MNKTHTITFTETTFKGLLAECWCGWNIETSNIPLVYKIAANHIDKFNYTHGNNNE